MLWFCRCFTSFFFSPHFANARRFWPQDDDAPPSTSFATFATFGLLLFAGNRQDSAAYNGLISFPNTHWRNRQLSAIWLSHPVIKLFGRAQMSSSGGYGYGVRRSQHQQIPEYRNFYNILCVVASVSDVCLLPYLSPHHPTRTAHRQVSHLSIYASVVAIYCFVVSTKRTFHADKWEIWAGDFIVVSETKYSFSIWCMYVCPACCVHGKFPTWMFGCESFDFLWLNAWAHLGGRAHVRRQQVGFSVHMVPSWYGFIAW